ncbi:hypothetical protein ANN_15589 [Periplaneta americana]|uniref:Uncharacterized protein n=1 Tax=Periplaneta americana TaxID=6978 RepID=A0ABQ8SGS5_PERAM|nr:hypothetical protein ANN_15589 [Periplaneta americana]
MGGESLFPMTHFHLERVSLAVLCYPSPLMELLSLSGTPVVEIPCHESLLSKNLKVRIYKTVITPVVLYGCGTWTLTLREEQRLRVFENKVLRKLFGANRDEVTGEWRKLHNTELHALYSSPDIIRNIKSRRLRWAGHVARMGESRNAYRADIVPELAPCYESEDETMGRRNKVASDLHLQRNKRGTPLYSKEDIREQYCITSKQLDVLERARGSGLFGCLSNYHCTVYNSTNAQENRAFLGGFITTLFDAKYSYVKIIGTYKTRGFVISKKGILCVPNKTGKAQMRLIPEWKKQANPPPVTSRSTPRDDTN